MHNISRFLLRSSLVYKKQLRTVPRFYFSKGNDPNKNFTKIDDIDSLLSEPKSNLQPEAESEMMNSEQSKQKEENKDPADEKQGFNSQVVIIQDVLTSRGITVGYLWVLAGDPVTEETVKEEPEV
jgi:hypothetical protein